MIREVECFGPEHEGMVFVSWNEVHGLLQGGVVALEAGSEDLVAGASRSKLALVESGQRRLDRLLLSVGKALISNQMFVPVWPAKDLATWTAW